MTAFWLWILLTSSTNAVSSSLNASICTPGGAKVPEVPKLPRYFSLNVQINTLDEHIDQGFSTFVSEKYDATRRRGKMVESKYYKERETIYDRLQNVLIKVEHLRSLDEATCQVRKLDEADGEFYIFGSHAISPVDIMMRIESVSKETFKFYYAGQITLDNVVITNYWKACFYDVTRKSTFYIRYFWSNNSAWTGSNCDVQNEGLCDSIPVRLEITEFGRFYTDIKSKLKTVYEFSNFVQEYYPFADLEAPKQVYCRGFNSSKQFPTLPSSYSFDVEELYYTDYDDVPDIRSYANVRYNNVHNLESVFKNDRRNVIRDLKNDVEYSSVKESGRCDVTRLSANGIFPNSSFSNVTNYLRLLETLSLENKRYNYNGKYRVRHIPVHVFVGTTSHDGQDIVIEWYFQDMGLQEIGDPVQVVRRYQHGGHRGRYEMHITSWISHQHNLEAFDVSSCYTSSQTRLISITFTAAETKQMRDIKVKHEINVELGNIMNVRIQRINSIHIEVMTETEIEVRYTLLGLPKVANYTDASDESNIHEAMKRLQEKKKAKNFEINVMTNTGKSIKLRCLSIYVGMDKYLGSNKKNERSHCKIGILVGLGVGMTFIGIVLGFCIIRKVPTRCSKKKKKQKNRKPSNNFDNPLHDLRQ